MNNSANNSNPFTALLNASDDQINDTIVSQNDCASDKSLINIDNDLNQQLSANNRYNERELLVNHLLVSIFRFIVNPINLGASDGNKSIKIKCISLIDDSSSNCTPSLLTLDNVGQYLYERLMLSDLNGCVVDAYVDQRCFIEHMFDDRCEPRVLHYLYECYYRLECNTTTILATQQIINLRNDVITQSSLILCHPEFSPNFDEKSSVPLFLDLLDDYSVDINHKNILQTFITKTCDEIVRKVSTDDEEIGLTAALKSSYNVLCERFSRMSLIDHTLSRTLQSIYYFVCNANLAKSFIELNTPQINDRKTFQDTLLGLMLSITCLTRPTNKQFEFFLNPSQYTQHEHGVTEKNLGIQLNLVVREVHAVLYSLLKLQETRNLTLDWIECCLYSYRDRSKIWTNEMLMLAGSAQNASDGFIINLSAVLLQLSKPFCIPPSQKLLKVDARYCRLTKNKYGNQKYLEAIRTESFLIPSDGDDHSNEENFEINFMTQCFIATHKSLHLGFRVVNERFLKLVQELNQIQHAYEDASLQTSDRNADALQLLRQRMDRNMTQFLAMKTMLSEQQYLETMFNFHIATAIWLNNLAVNENEANAAKQFKKLNLPLSNQLQSKCLKSVPEFIIENVADLVIFVRRFSDKTFALPAINLEPLMSLILIFMGSPERMKNPHLRARLAEMLEALMPAMHSETNRYSFSANTEKLFTEHPFISELIPTLVHVFVSIEISEVSGESVAFEQKFQYRRPMYIVLKYLWSKEQHRIRMKELADYAEANMESITPPLFLRFINLLMNDAIFLLDEALSYMSKIRELQQERENNSNNSANISGYQRQQNEANFQHTGRLARFHNIIGRETIQTLSWLTEHIKTIFSHKTLVDRMAAMLNYFLLHLVGPKKRNFKVKDMNEYEFKPAEIVHDICTIYLNLANQENKKFKSFCLAVGRDDRSYSPQLLPSASDVLIKTGYGALSTDTLQVAQLIEQLLQYQRRREISLSEVPDEFMDPIMSSLMNDPVILPNSGVKVDRSTIARHLLSDQSDPFTRAPLTMDMVKPDTELKQRIKQFIEQKIKEKQNESQDTNNVT